MPSIYSISTINSLGTWTWNPARKRNINAIGIWSTVVLDSDHFRWFEANVVFQGSGSLLREGTRRLLKDFGSRRMVEGFNAESRRSTVFKKGDPARDPFIILVTTKRKILRALRLTTLCARILIVRSYAQLERISPMTIVFRKKILILQHAYTLPLSHRAKRVCLGNKFRSRYERYDTFWLMRYRVIYVWR